MERCKTCLVVGLTLAALLQGAALAILTDPLRADRLLDVLEGLARLPPESSSKS